MPTDDHYRKLERMYATAPINGFFRRRLHITEGRAELEFDRTPLTADIGYA